MENGIYATICIVSLFSGVGILACVKASVANREDRENKAYADLNYCLQEK